MRGLIPHGVLVACGCWFATTPASHAAENNRPDAAYANEPYWYRPGHPVDPADAATITTRPGFVAERVLVVPRELGSWTALCVDPQGRLIAAAQNRAGLFRVTPASPDDPAAQTKIEVLGGAAAAVGWSQGLLHAFDSLYVTVAEESDTIARGVYRLQDTDGDDQYDRCTLLFALDGAGEHGPHNIIVSPDGHSLVMICGNGTRLAPELQLRRPVATEGIDHLLPPGFVSSRPTSAGWVMHFDPEGGHRELICSGLRNSFDLAGSRAGDLFTFDSDMEWDLGTPWYRPTRICPLVSGGEFGWRDNAANWPEYYEDSVAPTLNVGPGSPTGLVFGYDAKFPARYQRALFVCDWTFATIHAVFLEPEGASYRADIEEFIGGTGLPVVDLVIGRDGAMYVVVGGRRLGSAIYRIRYTGTESVTPVTPDITVPPLHTLRRSLEQFHGRVDPAALEAAWPQLGHADRAIRFAARVAVESQPIATWRDRALGETNVAIRLTALLALARQGTPQDQIVVLRACRDLPWSPLTGSQKLVALRTCEIAIARSDAAAADARAALRPVLATMLPDADNRITREVSRLLCALGDESIIDRLLALMEADTGARDASGASTFTRNPKYGEAIRDMLESAPLLERMHHAQMLLWLADRWTTEQRRRWFTAVADAQAHSKGGHDYAQLWERIRETAFAHTPEAERAAVAALTAASPFAEVAAAVPPPKGPGHEWTIEEATALAGEQLSARSFSRGRELFAATGCIACHRVGGAGGSIGPDLSGLGQRFTPRDILESVIEPSRTISDQYRMVLVQTTDGRTYSGRIISRDESSTNLATNLLRPGQAEAIPNAAIASIQIVPVSTMPSGLLNPLNDDELLNLLAYLVSGAAEMHHVFRPAP